ncbi:MAG: hypothetical protein AAFR21_09525 [Pseudomonadota bacterium]
MAFGMEGISLVYGAIPTNNAQTLNFRPVFTVIGNNYHQMSIFRNSHYIGGGPYPAHQNTEKDVRIINGGMELPSSPDRRTDMFRACFYAGLLTIATISAAHAEEQSYPVGVALILEDPASADPIHFGGNEVPRWAHMETQRATKGPHLVDTPTAISVASPRDPALALHPAHVVKQEMWQTAEDLKYVDFFKAHR